MFNFWRWHALLINIINIRVNTRISQKVDIRNVQKCTNVKLSGSLHFSLHRFTFLHFWWADKHAGGVNDTLTPGVRNNIFIKFYFVLLVFNSKCFMCFFPNIALTRRIRVLLFCILHRVTASNTDRLTLH